MTIKCEESIDGQYAEFSITIKMCREKPSVTVGLQIDALDLDWERTFIDSTEVAITGFSMFGVGVYLKIQLENKPNKNLYLKVFYLITSYFLFKITL